jgi:hypothetical protein
MSGVTALVQLRTSGARLPPDVVELVASFLPTGFDLLPPLCWRLCTLAESVRFLEHYFRTPLLGPYDEMSERDYYLEEFAGTDDDNYMELLKEEAITVIQLVGVRGATARATMLSIFAPPVTSSFHLARARRIATLAMNSIRTDILVKCGVFEGVDTAVLVADLHYLYELLLPEA